MQNELNDKQIPQGFSIIPSHVLQSKKLKWFDKCVYAQVSSLSQQYGYCYASNKYMCELFGVKSVRTIQASLKRLEEEGLISIVLEVDSRKLYMKNPYSNPNEGGAKICGGGVQKFAGGGAKICAHNSISKIDKKNIGAKRAKDQRLNEQVDWVLSMCEKHWGKKFGKNKEGLLGEKTARSAIRARIKEGATGTEMLAVILHKGIEWRKDNYMKKYLEPTTVFRPSHFSKYLRQTIDELSDSINNGTYKEAKKVKDKNGIGYIMPNEISEDEFFTCLNIEELKNKLSLFNQ